MKTQVTNLNTVGNNQDVIAVQAVLAGDTNAFNEIYNKYFGHIFRSLSQKLNFNNTIAEDLTMETLAKVYVNLNKYNTSGTFNSWISKIAQNTLVDYIRSEQKHNGVSSYDAVLSNDSTESLNNPGVWQLRGDDKTPAELLEQKEEHKALYRAIRNIKNTNEKQCLTLFYLKELSLEEISRKTGLPVNSVKVYIKRGKDNVKGQLGL